MKIWFLLALMALGSGCATKAVQTEAFLKSPHGLPVSQEIESVPFINQEAGHCGPATLTMAMNWAGRPISVNEIAPQVYTPGMKGSFQTDMISAARRQGFMAVRIEGVNALMSEVAAGHPVIVFENLALSWAPTWHYALVFGYDLRDQTVLMHSGPEASKRWDMAKFERSWMLGDYWGLVVLPPGRLAAAADEIAHVTAAAGLEQAQKNPEAQVSYEAILARWPQSLGAKIGLANLAYKEKRFSQSVEWLTKATQEHPESAAAWHNRAFAEGAAQRLQEANRSARRALALVPRDSRLEYEKSLEKWLVKEN